MICSKPWLINVQTRVHSFEDNPVFYHEFIFLSTLVLIALIALIVLIAFLRKGFIFAILHSEWKVSSFIDKFIVLARWIALTGAFLLQNLAEIWSKSEAWASCKYFHCCYYYIV